MYPPPHIACSDISWVLWHVGSCFSAACHACILLLISLVRIFLESYVTLVAVSAPRVTHVSSSSYHMLTRYGTLPGSCFFFICQVAVYFFICRVARVTHVSSSSYHMLTRYGTLPGSCFFVICQVAVFFFCRVARVTHVSSSSYHMLTRYGTLPGSCFFFLPGKLFIFFYLPGSCFRVIATCDASVRPAYSNKFSL